jgi:hypothetical protein
MNETLRIIFLIYFLTHIPVTLILDLQAIFVEQYPDTLQIVYTWYISTYNDLLIARRPLWLKSFIWAELLFQMPFFFVASYGLLFKKNWIRIPSIVYGVHVATTVWAILAEIWFNEENAPHEKMTLICFYAPYFIIPAFLAGYMIFTDSPFSSKKAKSV